MSKSQEQQEAIKELKRLVKVGDKVYTQLNHVSRSGMSRAISLKIIKNNEARDITYLVGKALDYSMHRTKDGLSVGGCGMDMGFHLVYGMGRVMFPKGFKHNKNTHPRNGDTSPRDYDGGYALNHEWL
jgi:hypothetical protein